MLGVHLVSTVTPGKSPPAMRPNLYSWPRNGWAPARIVDATGMNGRIEPAPVSGVSTYSHFVSTTPATSVSRSNEAETPGAATELWPLLKSSSRPHTIFDLPTSPMMSSRPRSRVYENVSRAFVISASAQFLLIDPTKSIRPLIVTFGAAACAMTGGASSPTAAINARTTTSVLLITASSCVGLSCQRQPCSTHTTGNTNSYGSADNGLSLYPEAAPGSRKMAGWRGDSLPQGPETLGRGLPQRRLGGDQPGLPVGHLGLLGAALGREDQAHVVVGGVLG